MIKARQLVKILKREPREPIFMAMLDEAVVAGTNVIEIGSSDGYEARYLFKKYGDDIKIYILEPDSYNRNKITRILGSRDNFYLFSQAVSDQSGKGFFYLNKKKRNLSTAIAAESYDDSIKTEYVTLESFIKEQDICGPIVVKMDIEGYEVDVLRGSLDYLKRTNEVNILMEVHPLIYDEGRSLKGVLSELFDAGYRVALLETAALPRPDKFIKEGLEPIMEARGRGCYERGLYRNVDNEFVLKVACQRQLNPIEGPRKFTEKIVRSLLLVTSKLRELRQKK